MLEKIDSPSSLRLLSTAEKKVLAKELREKIIETVANNGGHLSSNLGMVEPTIALHTVFSSPKDKLIFDVGHQCYAHKLLTGRSDSFSTLRNFGGISGFPNRFESCHDVLTEGHSGTSISSALGIAEAERLSGGDAYTVAIVGDGSLTCGMTYEALNNCAGKKLKLIIIINDNEMSISKNIGGLHNYLNKVRTSTKYFRLKRGFERVLCKIPLVGAWFAKLLKKIKDFFKRVFAKTTLFEDLGLEFLGPVDGSDIEKLCAVLNEAKKKEGPCVVHMITKKGRGYMPAEEEAGLYHSVSPFNLEKGLSADKNECFSSHFGEFLCKLAEQDSKICAITAAMCDGTGLRPFAEKYPDRFFDVGIAEEHAVTFASGLSVGGMKPVLALYSTFAQRAFDQLMHDISIQRLPLTLVLDRAGLVAGDGVTHQGIFDYPMLAAIPNCEIYTPETYIELEAALEASLASGMLSVVKIPRGAEQKYKPAFKMTAGDGLYYSENIGNSSDVIITSGRITAAAHKAISLLERDDVALVKLTKTHPIPDRLSEITSKAKRLFVFEEGYRQGGFGQAIAARLGSSRVIVSAIDSFVEHGSLSELDARCGFTAEGMAQLIKDSGV